jgi:hypothetical protein
MTDQTDSGTTVAETTARPTTYHGAARCDRTWLDARDRYDELTQARPVGPGAGHPGRDGRV